jgi:CHAT domain-containing protein/tetratricopeptide (TPR) repeat protein
MPAADRPPVPFLKELLQGLQGVRHLSRCFLAFSLVGACAQAPAVVGERRPAPAGPPAAGTGAATAPAPAPRDHPGAALTAELGLDLMRQGRYAEAEPLLRRALSMREKALGPGDPNVAQSLDDLAGLYQDRGRYAGAEPLYGRALAVRERALGPGHPDVAASLGNLSTLYFAQGRYAEAEPLIRRALAIEEAALGPDHPDTARSLANLADVYRAQGRTDEAEPLYGRALAVKEKALGPDHPSVTQTLNNLALLYEDQGRYEEAEPLHRRALAVRERVLGPGHLDVAESLNNIAALYLVQDRYAEAEPLQERALALGERVLGPDHPHVGSMLNNLAEVYAARGRPDEAERLHRRALANAERALGPDHPSVARSLTNLAALYDGQGRGREALAAIRRVAAIRERWDAAARGSGAEAGPAVDLGQFLEVAVIGWRAAERDRALRPAVLDEALRAFQRLQAGGTGRAVARVAARFAAGDDELARLVREREDAAGLLRRIDGALVAVAGRPPAERDPALGEQLRGAFANVRAALDRLDGRLARDFPAYAELASARPAGVQEIQALLAPDEALLAYAVMGERRPGEEYDFVWLVRPDRAEWRRLDLAPGELEEAVRALRARLDPALWAGGAPPRFDAALAHRLHAKLLPFEPALLAGVRHLLVVPDGPLESLPFAVLVRTPPEPGAPYREVDWLPRTYATTTLPSVSSLRAMRRFAKPSRAAEPFRGIGDPALVGPESGARSADIARLLTRGLADPAQVRALPPLPETADELRTLARSLGAGEGSLLLRERATETAVKAGALSGARVVAFATHAGVAGELPGLAEPAVVLTPPAAATEEDDGLLTASEAARLKLDADLVLLSACNTAAPDGTPGAPGLSGLAKSFIYAGGRALLVSHWAVVSDAAQRLTSGMFAELARDPALGRAEALRRAEMALLDDPGGDPLLAHPAAWAPFVVVGEGGAGAPDVRADAAGR